MQFINSPLAPYIKHYIEQDDNDTFRAKTHAMHVFVGFFMSQKLLF